MQKLVFQAPLLLVIPPICVKYHCIVTQLMKLMTCSRFQNDSQEVYSFLQGFITFCISLQNLLGGPAKTVNNSQSKSVLKRDGGAGRRGNILFS